MSAQPSGYDLLMHTALHVFLFIASVSIGWVLGGILRPYVIGKRTQEHRDREDELNRNGRI